MSWIRKRYKFSVAGIAQLQKDMQTLQDKLPELQKKFIQYSVEFLEERAKAHLSESIGHSWYVPTGALMSSFQKENGAEMGRLFNNYFTALWVEYGTGIVGAGTHPNPNGYQYDVNNHGEDGWVFKDKDGEYHFTRGMEAHRYMHSALIDYINGGADKMFAKAFDEVIGGALK